MGQGITVQVSGPFAAMGAAMRKEKIVGQGFTGKLEGVNLEVKLEDFLKTGIVQGMTEKVEGSLEKMKVIMEDLISKPGMKKDRSVGLITEATWPCDDRQQFIEPDHVCNGHHNCADGSDEKPELCTGKGWKCEKPNSDTGLIEYIDPKYVCEQFPYCDCDDFSSEQSSQSQ